MSTSTGWEPQETCPYRYISNAIPSTIIRAFLVAPYFGANAAKNNVHFNKTGNSFQRFNVNNNKWQRILKYPHKFQSTHHQICSNNRGEIFMYGQESSAIFALEGKLKIKKGKKKLMPGAQIIYHNNAYHIIGGDYNRTHYEWNYKKSKFVEIYEFKDWSAFGMKEYGIISVNECLLLLGGYSSKDLNASKNIYQFNENGSNVWKLLDLKMPNSQPLYAFGYVKHLKNVFIFGGENSHRSPCNDIWILDVSNMEWKEAHIKCPIKDMFYAVIPKVESNNSDVWVHLLSRTTGKHWKISVNEIMNGYGISDEKKNEEFECKIESKDLLEQRVSMCINIAINNMSKAIDLLQQNNGIGTDVSDIQSKINVLKGQIEVINNKILSVNVKDYHNWGMKEIAMYIGQIEKGRFGKYVQNIEKVLSAMNIVSGGELPEISGFMLKKFGIENDSDRNDLIQYFVSLKTGGNYVPSAPSAAYQELVEVNDETEEMQIEGGHAETVGNDKYT